MLNRIKDVSRCVTVSYYTLAVHYSSKLSGSCLMDTWDFGVLEQAW